MAKVYLLLGTNMGDREKNLSESLFYLSESSIEVLAKSAIYETDPWGYEDQPVFYNQAVEVSTALMPEDLLNVIKGIERKMGRENFGRWKERLIDIDIIYYDRLIYNDKDLIIPHPALQERMFALLPLSEIAGDFIHPVLKVSTTELMKKCSDLLKVKKIVRGDE